MLLFPSFFRSNSYICCPAKLLLQMMAQLVLSSNIFLFIGMAATIGLFRWFFCISYYLTNFPELKKGEISSWTGYLLFLCIGTGGYTQTGPSYNAFNPSCPGSLF